MADSLLDNYNPLYDIHLRQYFALPHMQKHLQKMGLLESTLNLNGDEVYARHHAMMDMMLKNREAQLVKMAELKQKLDAAEKIELCRRIRSGQSPESYRRGKPSRSLSRSRGAQRSGRQRRFSNSFEDKDFVQHIEQDNADPVDYNTKDPYKRLSANAKRFNYLHKLDDPTLIAYKDNLKRQLQRLERFREISFGPHSVARHAPPPQTSWFFRRRSLPSLIATAPGNRDPLRSVLSIRGRKDARNTGGNKLNLSHDSRTSCPPTTRKRRDSNSRLPPIQGTKVKTGKPPAPASSLTVKLPPTVKKQSPSRGRPPAKRVTTTTTTTTTSVTKTDSHDTTLDTSHAISGGGGAALAAAAAASAAAAAAAAATGEVNVETLHNVVSSPIELKHQTPTPPHSPALETQRTFDRSSPTDLDQFSRKTSEHGSEHDENDIQTPDQEKNIIGESEGIDNSAFDNHSEHEYSNEWNPDHSEHEESNQSIPDHLKQEESKQANPNDVDEVHYEVHHYTPPKAQNNDGSNYNKHSESESESEPEYAEEDKEIEDNQHIDQIYSPTNTSTKGFESEHHDQHTQEIPELKIDYYQNQETEHSPVTEQDHIVVKRETGIESPENPITETAEHAVDDSEKKETTYQEQSDDAASETQEIPPSPTSPLSYHAEVPDAHHEVIDSNTEDESFEKAQSVHDDSSQHNDLSSSITSEHFDEDVHSIPQPAAGIEVSQPNAPILDHVENVEAIPDEFAHQLVSELHEIPQQLGSTISETVEEVKEIVQDFSHNVEQVAKPESPDLSDHIDDAKDVSHEQTITEAEHSASPVLSVQDEVVVPGTTENEHHEQQSPRSFVDKITDKITEVVASVPSSVIEGIKQVQETSSEIVDKFASHTEDPSIEQHVEVHGNIAENQEHGNREDNEKSDLPSPTPSHESYVAHRNESENESDLDVKHNHHEHDIEEEFEKKIVQPQETAALESIIHQEADNEAANLISEALSEAPMIINISESYAEHNDFNTEHHNDISPSDDAAIIHDPEAYELKYENSSDTGMMTSIYQPSDEHEDNDTHSVKSDNQSKTIPEDPIEIIKNSPTPPQSPVERQPSPVEQKETLESLEQVEAEIIKNSPTPPQSPVDRQSSPVQQDETVGSPVQINNSIIKDSPTPPHSPIDRQSSLVEAVESSVRVETSEPAGQMQTTASVENIETVSEPHTHKELTATNENLQSHEQLNQSPRSDHGSDNVSTDSLIIHEDPEDHIMTHSVYQPENEPAEHVEEKNWIEDDQQIHQITKNTEFSDENGKHFSETVTTTTTVTKSNDEEDLKNNNDDDEDDESKHVSHAPNGENGNVIRETITTTTTTHSVSSSGLPASGFIVDDGEENISSI